MPALKSTPYIVGVPPIPRHFAGLDPRSVLDLRRFFQQPDDLIREKVAIFFDDTEDTPRKRARAFGDGDIVGAFRDFQIAVAFEMFLERIRWESGGEAVGAGDVEPEAGIFLDVGFGN